MLIVGMPHLDDTGFKLLVEQSPDAMFVHRDAPDDYTIRYVNPAMVRLLGYAGASDLLGQRSIDTVIHPEDRDLLLAFRRRRYTGADDEQLVLRWVRRDGSVAVIDGRSTRLVL